jgi:nucleotide-binding universal stress UspA family protein
MKTILVPTDFSQNAYTALLYAADLAERQRARLVLLHVFQKATYWFETLTEIREKENALRQDSLRQLEELKNSPALSGRQLEITTEIRNGRVTQEILELVRKMNMDMIVMGSKCATFPGEGLHNTLTTEVVEKTSCPVLVIPSGMVYQPIQNIVSAIDYHDSDLLHTIELTEIASLFKANITLLHIAQQPSPQAPDLHPLDQLKAKACTHTRYTNIHTQLLEGKNFFHRLKQYVEKNGTELLVMASKKRNASEKVSGPGITKQMIGHTQIPMLIFKAFDMEVAY